MHALECLCLRYMRTCAPGLSQLVVMHEEALELGYVMRMRCSVLLGL